MAQEGMHSIKTKKLKGVVLKIDMSKAYDKVSWLYIRMILTHLRFYIGLIKWVMSCISIVSFAILINGSTLLFFFHKDACVKDVTFPPCYFYWYQKGLVEQ